MGSNKSFLLPMLAGAALPFAAPALMGAMGIGGAALPTVGIGAGALAPGAGAGLSGLFGSGLAGSTASALPGSIGIGAGTALPFSMTAPAALSGAGMAGVGGTLLPGMAAGAGAGALGAGFGAASQGGFGAGIQRLLDMDGMKMLQNMPDFGSIMGDQQGQQQQMMMPAAGIPITPGGGGGANLAQANAPSTAQAVAGGSIPAHALDLAELQERLRYAQMNNRGAPQFGSFTQDFGTGVPT